MKLDSVVLEIRKPTPQDTASSILGDCKLRSLVIKKWHNVHGSFCENRSVGLKVEKGSHRKASSSWRLHTSLFSP
jgi:hypothetical protein